MANMIKIKIERTKKDFPALWELGGGQTNTGSARIICSADGSPKKATYIRRRGHLAGGNHALLIVGPGDVVIEADHHRGDFHVAIYKIKGFEDEVFGDCGLYGCCANDIEAAEKEFSRTGWAENCIQHIVRPRESKDSGRVLSTANIVVEYWRRWTVEYASLEPIAEYSRGEWDNEEIAQKYKTAIEAAKEKALCYHCREPHYIAE